MRQKLSSPNLWENWGIQKTSRSTQFLRWKVWYILVISLFVGTGSGWFIWRLSEFRDFQSNDSVRFVLKPKNHLQEPEFPLFLGPLFRSQDMGKTSYLLADEAKLVDFQRGLENRFLASLDALTPKDSQAPVTSRPVDSETSNSLKQDDTSSVGSVLWRVFVETRETENVSKLLNQLKEFQAVKGGQADLGWQKKTDLYYFHFIVNSVYEPEILEFLKSLGEVKSLSKEKSPRKLEKGLIRFIIEIKVLSAQS